MVKYVSENFSVCENTNIKYYIYSPTYFSPSLRRFRNCILVEVFRRHTLCTICSPTSSINLWTAKQTCGLLPKVCWVLRVTVIPLKVHFSLQDDGVCQTIHLFFSIYLVYFSCIQMKHFFWINSRKSPQARSTGQFLLFLLKRWFAFMTQTIKGDDS